MDVIGRVVWFPKWSIGTIVKIEGDIQIVNYFQIASYCYIQPIALKNFHKVLLNSLCFRPTYVFECRKTIISVKSDFLFFVFRC